MCEYQSYLLTVKICDVHPWSHPCLVPELLMSVTSDRSKDLLGIISYGELDELGEQREFVSC